jgi:proline iminopeptidase
MKASARGAEIFYTTRGDGPACIVLSSMGTKPYERMMPAQLSERVRLAFVDLRGDGPSTGEVSDLTFDVLADDLEAVRVALGAEKVAVLGHSILGVLAIEYGRRRPESVSHVIAVGTPPRGDMAWLQAKATAFFEADASEDRKRVLRENMAALPPGAPLAQMLIATTPMRFYDARFDAAPLFAEAEVKPALSAHLLGPLTREWEVTSAAGSLEMPMLLVHGRYDYTVPQMLWDGVIEKLPTASMQIFERSGHHPFVEEPERFANVVADWMATERRTGASGC